MSTETKRRRTAAKSADTEAVLRGPIVDAPAPLASQVVERSRSAVTAYEAWMAANKLWLELDEKDGDEAPQTRAAVRRAARLSQEAGQLIEDLISARAMTADELVEKAALMWSMLYRAENRADMTLHERYGQSVALDVQRLLGREVVDIAAASVEVAAPIETIDRDLQELGDDDDDDASIDHTTPQYKMGFGPDSVSGYALVAADARGAAASDAYDLFAAIFRAAGYTDQAEVDRLAMDAARLVVQRPSDRAKRRAATDAVVSSILRPKRRPPIVPGRGPNAYLPGGKIHPGSSPLLISSIPFGNSVDHAVSAAIAILCSIEKDDRGRTPDTEALRWVLQRLGKEADDFNAVVLRAQAEGRSHV